MWVHGRGCLTVAVSLSLWFKPIIQGIKQQPMRTIATVIVIKDVKEEVTVAFHFPNHCSIKLVKQLSLPEFSASSLE